MQMACLQQGCGDHMAKAAREVGLHDAAGVPMLHERATFLK